MDTHNFELIVQQVLDGTASAEDSKAVIELLNESEEHRLIYCRHTQLQALLSQRAHGIKSLLSPTPIIPLEVMQQAQRKQTIRWISAGTIAATLILGFFLSTLFITPAPTGLTFQTAPETQFTLTHSSENPEHEQSMQTGSRLDVTQGALELTFASGVKSIVEAPAELTLLDDNKVYLAHGKAWFQVPEEAIGFTVESPQMEVIDLGTEFAILSNTEGDDQCYVYKGKVEINALYSAKQSAKLTAGNALSTTQSGLLKETPLDQNSFLTSLPKKSQHIHWSFDEINDDKLDSESNYPSLAKVETRVISDHPTKSNLTKGKFGKALQLKNAGDHVTSDWKGLAGRQPRTVAFWIKPVSSKNDSYHSLLGWGDRHRDSITQDYFLFFTYSLRNGTSRIGLTTGAFQSMARPALDNNKWHHIACVLHGGLNNEGYPNIDFYLDGSLVSVLDSDYKENASDLTIDTLTDTFASSPFSIGSSLHQSPNYDFQRGTTIDELHIFGSALNSKEVNSLYFSNTTD